MAGPSCAIDKTKYISVASLTPYGGTYKWFPTPIANGEPLTDDPNPIEGSIMIGNHTIYNCSFQRFQECILAYPKSFKVVSVTDH